MIKKTRYSAFTERQFADKQGHLVSLCHQNDNCCDSVSYTEQSDTEQF